MPSYSPPWVEPGWPNLPDQGMAMVSAFQAGANISNRRQQLENQLAQMALRQQNQEMMMGLREAEFNRKLDQGNQRLALAEAGLNMRGIMDEFRMRKDKETMDDISGLATGLSAIDMAADDPRRPSAIMNVVSTNARGAKAMPGMVKDYLSQYNHAAASTQSSLKTDLALFNQEIKNTFGKGQITDYNLLFNENQWKDVWQDPSGNTEGVPAPPDPAHPPPGYKKTNSKFALLPSGQPGVAPVPVTLPTQEITSLRTKWENLKRRLDNMPQQVANEYVTPQQTGGAAAAGNKRAEAEAWLRAKNLPVSDANIQHYYDNAP